MRVSRWFPKSEELKDPTDLGNIPSGSQVTVFFFQTNKVSFFFFFFLIAFCVSWSSQATKCHRLLRE